MNGKVTAGGKGFSAEIRVEGLKETMAALKTFEPEVYKALRKSIRTELKRVEGLAGRIGGGSYKVTMKDAGKRPGGGVTGIPGNKQHLNDWSAPATRAVIMEFARRGKTPQAQSMIDSYQARYGSPGRMLWRAWDSGLGDEVLRNIDEAIRDAETTLQARLESAGEAF